MSLTVESLSGGQNVHHRVGMAMEGNARVGFEQLAVQSTQDAHNMLAPDNNGLSFVFWTAQSFLSDSLSVVI